MKIKNIFNVKLIYSKKFFSTKSSDDYLTVGKKFFLQGKYQEAGQGFQHLNVDDLKKDELDIVVSTFIKTGNIYNLNEILPKLPSNYTIFTPKYSILHLATIYNKPNVILLLAKKGLLEDQLTRQDANGLIPVKTAILSNNHKFFEVVKANISKNFDLSKLPSHESAKSLLISTHANSKLHQAVDNLYSSIKTLEEVKGVVHISDNIGGITEAVLLGTNIESANEQNED